MTTLRTETGDGVRQIVLTRAAEYNTITPALRDELAAAIDDADADHDVRVVLLRAEGPAFCAGYGLDWSTAAQADESKRVAAGGRVWDSVGDYRMMKTFVDTYMKLWYAHKPTIAAVQGWGLPEIQRRAEALRETTARMAQTPAKDAETLVRQCGIAAGLGESSLHLWLKVPIVDDLARVCRATTLPLLLLGGPARGTAEETLRDFATALAAGSRIRGAIIGRNLLYPGDADPMPLSRALTALVHRGASLEDALSLLSGTPRPRRKSAAGRG